MAHEISKLEVHAASVGVKSVAVNPGRVPDNLAQLGLTVIGLFKANGDLGWLDDMIREAEAGPDDEETEQD